MAMDTNLPEESLEQEKAEHIIREYAKEFKDVAYTNPSSGKTGFEARTPDNKYVVTFGFDQTFPKRSCWYYSVSSNDERAYSVSGSGMAKAEVAQNLIEKVISGQAEKERHERGVKENEQEKARHELKEFGVISPEKDKDGLYDTIPEE